MKRWMFPIFGFIYTFPTFGNDALIVNIAEYDTLLINHQYEELMVDLEHHQDDLNLVKKYKNLIGELKYISEYSPEELVGMSEIGLKYEIVFSPYQSGEVASNYYKIYRKYFEEQNFTASVRILKIAHSHRASYLLNLWTYVNRRMDEAQLCLKSGNFSLAYDILSPLEEDIYNIEKLREFREVFDMRFTRCKFIGEDQNKQAFLSEIKFNPMIKYEISLQSGLLLWGKDYQGERQIYYQYSNSPDSRTPYTISGFEASEGYGFGFNLYRRLTPQTQLLLSYGVTTTTYIAHNDVTGWDTDFSFRDRELGFGVRYYLQDKGRLRWWTSAQFRTVSMSPIEKTEESSAHTDANRYIVSFEKMSDNQLELDLGFSLFLKSGWQVSVQPHLKYIVSIETPYDNRSNRVLGVLCIGTYF